MTIRLRPYQVEACAAVKAAHERGVRRPAVVAATGAGKTIMLASTIRDHLARRGGRALVLAHRTELIENNAQKIMDVAPDLRVGVVKANRNDTRADVISASVQTLAGERRRQMIADVGLVVIDECHRATAKSYLDVLSHYGCMGAEEGGTGALAAGFTATMVRGDGAALGDVWQEIVYTRDISSLVAEGYLCRPRGLRVRVEDLDLSKVKRSGGDYQDAALGAAIEQSLAPEAIAKAMLEHAAGRPTILFAPTVHSAGVIRDALVEAGITAALVHADTPDDERRAVAAESESGRVQVVCNALLYTEGTDWPWISCVVIARPTRSKGTFVQMAGRGLRLYPGKQDCLIMMIGGAAAGHSLMAPVELFGETAAADFERDPCTCDLGISMYVCPCGTRRCLDECPCGGGGRDCGCPRPTGDELLQGELDGELEEMLGADGPLVAHEVDLFADSKTAWNRTGAGIWYIGAGDRYIAIVPGDPSGRGGWDVVSINKPHGSGSAWIARGVSELAYAMAHGEGDVTPVEARLAKKNARWRSGRASEAQLRYAARLGVVVSPIMTSGEVSAAIDRALATHRIDGRIPAYARERLMVGAR